MLEKYFLNKNLVLIRTPLSDPPLFTTSFLALVLKLQMKLS